MQKMKIEIWSDIMCPFCYIGKRKFEKSLANLSDRNLIEVEWKSYQLSPDAVTNESLSTSQYLMEKRGLSAEQSAQMQAQVVDMAAQEGLEFNLENTFVTNSMKAHVLAHFAKQYGKQDEAEELLFKSYFTENKNVDDINVLKSIASQLGLDTDLLEKVVQEGSLEEEVRKDIYEASQIGVRGVPFFVYDQKYAISGAQPIELFVQTVEKSLEEWKGKQSSIIIQDSSGASCDITGCD